MPRLFNNLRTLENHALVTIPKSTTSPLLRKQPGVYPKLPKMGLAIFPTEENRS
jgi:hypothetical protein